MDAVGLGYLIKSTLTKLSNAEKFETTTTVTTTEVTKNNTTNTPPAEGFAIFGIIIMIVVFIFTVIIGGYSAYLSWYANTLIEWGTGYKVLFSFFAFLSGVSYLLSYLIYKLDLLNNIRRSKGLIV